MNDKKFEILKKKNRRKNMLKTISSFVLLDNENYIESKQIENDEKIIKANKKLNGLFLNKDYVCFGSENYTEHRALILDYFHKLYKKNILNFNKAIIKLSTDYEENISVVLKMCDLKDNIENFLELEGGNSLLILDYNTDRCIEFFPTEYCIIFLSYGFNVEFPKPDKVVECPYK